MKKVNKIYIKRGAVIISFIILGILFSIGTQKYLYYIPSSIVIGTIVAISFFKEK